MKKRAFLGPVVALAAAAALALPLAAGADPGKQTYILALGDSATAGTQPIAPAPPDAPGGAPETEVNRSGQGYADQLAAHLREEGTKAELVNLACYYETTATMIQGGGLCSYPHGSQLDEAAQFLHAHGGHVGAVVMSLGANDMLRSCPLFFQPGAQECFADRLATAGANLATILERLRAEGGDVPIAMIDYWDPFLALWFLPGVGPTLAQLSVGAVVMPLKQMIVTASAPYGVTLVDTLATFETENFSDMGGGVPLNVALMCTYSWMCTHNDIHLNEDGYGVIANAVEQTLGL